MARQRLRPWLLHTLDEGKVPGVEWVYRDEQIFRIPWKHGSKQDWTAQDSKIFLDWAIHTGKHREGIDEPNFAQCKTRLRCALNKAPDIRERKDLENHDRPDPYKVYQFVDINAEQIRQLTEAEDKKEEMDMEVESPDQPIPTVVYDYSVKPADRAPEKLPSDLVDMSSVDLVTAGLNSDNMSKYLSSMTTLPGTGELEIVHQQNVYVENVTIVPTDDKQDVIGSSASPAETYVGDNVVVDGQFNDTPTIEDQTPPPLQVTQVDDLHQLKTKVECHYRSMYTLERTVQKSEGFRIYYGSIPPNVSEDVFSETFGPLNLEQIHLSDPRQFMQTEQQMKYTTQILESFCRGVYFKCINGDIYAKRLCKPSVFYKSNTTDYTVQKLERNTADMTKVFDFNVKFRTELTNFMPTKESRLAPTPTIYLSVGQRPQKDDMSENLLIRVKITHMIAQYYLEQAVGSEFPSICISNADEGDDLATFLKGFHIGEQTSTVQ